MIQNSKTTTLKIDTSRNILEQFAQQLSLEINNNTFTINSKLGKGQMQLIVFPGKLEFYHLTCKLNTPVQIQSSNPINSEWLLLNINLSNSKFTKKVNTQQIDFHKHLPSGILMYTPHTEVQSISPPFIPFEIILIRFHKSFLKQYNYKNSKLFHNTEKVLIYEDLNVPLERHIKTVIENKNNKLIAHSELLRFLSIFLQKIEQRDPEKNYRGLHADDLKGLFLAAAKLRNPLARKLPTVDTLAKIAGMGTTKFKTIFKQVFGSPPIKYHQKIKMEYARIQLENNQKSASEVSYELGYSHPSKFTVAYKKQFNTLPSKV